MRQILTYIFCMVLGLFILSSCGKDGGKTQNEETRTYKIAVMLPYNDADNRQRINQTAELFLENFEYAQFDRTSRIAIEFEWFDEPKEADDAYYIKTAKEIADNDEYVAFIGPYYSKHAMLMTSAMYSKGKLMVAPVCTSAELLRANSGHDFFWCLCEPDITQCEVLLTKALSYGASSVALLTNKSIYGQTYIDWIAFQASEMGMSMNGIFDTDHIEDALACGADYIICAPDNVDDVERIITTNSALSTEHRKRLLFSDIAFEPSVLSFCSTDDEVEGIAPYALPSSGFEIYFESRFGYMPGICEAYFYDAMALTSMAVFIADSEVGQDGVNAYMNNAMKGLLSKTGVDGEKKPDLTIWTYEGMYRLMQNPTGFDINGVTGGLDFDVNKQGSVTHSVYCHWLIYQGQLLTLDFLSSDASNRVSSISSAWEWKASITQDFENSKQVYVYPEHKDSWAVLVCGSRGWYNYRHFSDVLDMYRLLKKNGYSDDRIILIAADDVVNDNHNINKGFVRKEVGGENLYQNVVIDYHTDTLKAKDVCSILLGKKSEHLPTVVESDEHSNILVYWSGHGEFGRFLWGSDDALASGDIKAALRDMNADRRFRKLLFCCEPCFSGSVLSEVEGIPGVLGLAAANGFESSFADNYDPSMSVWLTDRFSNQLISLIEAEPEQTYRSLYMNLVKNTMGSHVTMFNYLLFDNLYFSSPYEFFVR